MSQALVPVFGSRPVFVTVRSDSGPVALCVAVHDAYYMRTRASWRRLLVRTGGPRVTAEGYHAWQAAERAWYRQVGLTPPGLTVHRRAGRRLRMTCRTGQALCWCRFCRRHPRRRAA